MGPGAATRASLMDGRGGQCECAECDGRSRESGHSRVCGSGAVKRERENVEGKSLKGKEEPRT